MRPAVPVQIVREYGYAYAAVSPHDGVLDTLVLPTVNAEAMGMFLVEVAGGHADEFIVMVLDGAGWYRAKRLQVPENLRLILFHRINDMMRLIEVPVNRAFHATPKFRLFGERV